MEAAFDNTRTWGELGYRPGEARRRRRSRLACGLRADNDNGDYEKESGYSDGGGVGRNGSGG